MEAQEIFYELKLDDQSTLRCIRVATGETILRHHGFHYDAQVTLSEAELAQFIAALQQGD